VGTGNYNPKTARLYEDVGLLSADPDLGADLTDLFNFLTGYSRQVQYRKILVAPYGLRSRIIDRIRAEAARGEDGRIVMKMNGLDDAAIIEELYAASQAGTEVDLLLRSICCLRPGVPGLSDRIRVRSIVGRYLEHSRIFRFGKGDRTRFLIGSADMRGRNLYRRIEVVVPVDDPQLKARLDEILALEMADDAAAWTLCADGTWAEPPGGSIEAQRRLQELAALRAQPWLEDAPACS
jgi:polyphosphate kinase